MRLNYQDVIKTGEVNIDNLKIMGKLTEEEIGNMEDSHSLMLKGKLPRYVGATDEDRENMKNWSLGDFGEKMTILVLKYVYRLKDMVIHQGLRLDDENPLIIRREFEGWEKRMSEESLLLALLLKGHPDVSIEFDYRDEHEKLEKYESLSNFQTIFYSGDLKFVSKNEIPLPEYRPYPENMGFNVMPGSRNLHLISEIVGYELNQQNIGEHYLKQEVQETFQRLSRLSLQSLRAYYLDTDDYEIYLKNQNLRRKRRSLYKKLDRQFHKIISRYRDSADLMAFDLLIEAKYRKNLMLYPIEVKSSKISCDQHDKRGPVSLSKNQRSSLKKLLTSEFYSRRDIKVLISKINICECGKIVYYLIRPKLI